MDRRYTLLYCVHILSLDTDLTPLDQPESRSKVTTDN
jgi:hypothetical protein